MPRKSLIYLPFIISVLCSSCEFNCSVGESNRSEGEKKRYKPEKKDGALLYNGIHLVTRGVQVDKAYLTTDEDRPERIDEDNFIDIKKGVKMVLHLKDSWKELDGKVRIGASMEAKFDNGALLVKEQDLFKDYDKEGIAPADSKIISLSLYLKENLTSGRPVSIKVDFKVWDKQSDAFIEGNYTVHTR
jgi:hypothetical protein